MERNKVRTYIFYALGEIALVMIGILLALQVNNWNEERKENENRNELAINLLEELKTVKDYNQEVISFNTEYRDKIIEFVNAGCGQNINALKDSIANGPTNWVLGVASLQGYLFGFANVYAPNIKNYKKAANDGSIALIRNDISFNLENIYVSLSDFNNQMVRLVRQRNEFLQSYIATHYGQVITESSFFDNNTWDHETEFKLLELTACDGTIMMRLSEKSSSLNSKIIVTQNHMALMDSTILLLEEFISQ